jgi:DNA-binding response OmpR family regulator
MRLLLVEDSDRLRSSLCAGLTREGFAVDAVADGERGLTMARRGVYDVVILDLMLPRRDGWSVLEELRRAASEVHVLILTARSAVPERVRGLQLGADDYLQKPFDFDELVARVQALVRRRYHEKPPCLRVSDLTIDTVGRTVLKGSVEVRLTRREFQLLEYLARRKGQTVSRIDIEDHIYGERNLPESNAVESSVCTLRRKLKSAGGDPRELIQTRHGQGYCLALGDGP